MRNKVAKQDREIARFAERQHGVISARQLAEVGLSRATVVRRVEDGRLYRVHRGVYAVGHPGISQCGRWMAAVLACGDGAAISHRSAGELWGLLPLANGLVAVSVRGGGGRARRPDIRVHRRASLRVEDTTRRNGIPVTKPAQTIADMKGRVSAADLRRAIRQADVLGLPLGWDTRSDRTRSDLERDFLRICRRHGLPAPEVNVRLGPYLVDFLWRDHRLLVETDGYRYHRGRQAFRDDRVRGLDLQGRGWRVVRLSEDQVGGEPERVAEILRKMLASRPHRVGPDGL